MLRRPPVVEIEGDLVETAVVVHQQNDLSFWDGLIIGAARRMGCARLLSEDLRAGMTIDGLSLVTPFTAG